MDTLRSASTEVERQPSAAVDRAVEARTEEIEPATGQPSGLAPVWRDLPRILHSHP